MIPQVPDLLSVVAFSIAIQKILHTTVLGEEHGKLTKGTGYSGDISFAVAVR